MSDYDENVQNSDQPENESDGKKKLTDTQLRILQAIAGVISAAALLVSLFFMEQLKEINDLLQYLFLAIFLIIMFGRRSIENKYRLRLNLFGLVLIDGILGGIVLFVLISPINLSLTWRLIILIGGIVLLLGLGVGFPLFRYLKRKADGTVPPIRIPEKKEDPEAEKAAQENRPMSIEEKIAQMTRELDEGIPQDQDDSEKDQ